MKRYLLALGASVVLAAFGAVGCGPQGVSSDEIVGGSVTLDGAPVGNATVTLVPAKGESVVLTTSPAGSFIASGDQSKILSKGKCRVGVVGQGVPEKYADPEQSGVEFEANRSGDSVEIPLTN